MTEKVREMMRQNYASQLEGLGYGPDGNPLPKKQEWQWISIKDRLPDESGMYLVHTRNGVIHLYFYDQIKSMWYENSGWTIQKSFITHWMPLPEPPKGDANEP